MGNKNKAKKRFIIRQCSQGCFTLSVILLIFFYLYQRLRNSFLQCLIRNPVFEIRKPVHLFFIWEHNMISNNRCLLQVVKFMVNTVQIGSCVFRWNKLINKIFFHFWSPFIISVHILLLRKFQVQFFFTHILCKSRSSVFWGLSYTLAFSDTTITIRLFKEVTISLFYKTLLTLSQKS